jgi:hypothetical protein
MAEQAGAADPHLLPVRLRLQTGVVGIEPIEKCRIIRVKD